MKVSDSLELDLYDYDLPPELIAQHPADRRDGSRLMRLDARTGRTSHHYFVEIVDFLQPGDVLAVNDTRVVPARILGRKLSGGRVEVLLLNIPSGRPSDKPVECLVKGAKGLKPGQEYVFEAGLSGAVKEVVGYGRCLIEFTGPDENWVDLLKAIGRVPLPPYIKRAEPPKADSPEAKEYQTVYAAQNGAVAAPTAGLHFTPELMAALVEKGVEFVKTTLHVGYGTFEPLRLHHLASGRLHAEDFCLSDEAAEVLNRAVAEDRRLVAVGTSTVRLLEHLAHNGGFRPYSGRTELLVGPGFQFKAIRAMVTNFHLPRSSLLMLVSALAGREKILAAYDEALKADYRFYSFGDAMFIEA